MLLATEPRMYVSDLDPALLEARVSVQNHGHHCGEPQAQRVGAIVTAALSSLAAASDFATSAFRQLPFPEECAFARGFFN